MSLHKLPKISETLSTPQNVDGERGVKGETEILEEIIMEATSHRLKFRRYR